MPKTIQFWRLTPVLIVVLSAYWLRTFHLGTQSLWYDEAFSVYVSRHDWGDLVRLAASVDNHPPFYYLLLHLMVLAAGPSEFTVRYLSVVGGVLAVPVTVNLARMTTAGAPFSTRLVAVSCATMLVTCSPSLIWYSQEARMYSQVIAFGLAGSAGLLLLLKRLDCRLAWRAPCAWLVVCDLAALYTHLFAALLIAAHALVVLIWTVHHVVVRPQRAEDRLRARQVLVPILSLITVAAAFIPGATFAQQMASGDVSYLQGTMPAWVLIHDTTLLYVGGDTPQPAFGIALAIGVAAVLIVLAGVLAVHYVRTTGVALLFAAALLPPILLYPLIYAHPKFSSRYLLVSAPYWYVLVGLGLGVLASSRARAPAFVRAFGVVLPTAALLLLLWANEWQQLRVWRGEVARDNWRGATAFIRDHNGDGDPILVVSGHAFPALLYYLPDAHWKGLPPDLTISTTHTVNFGDADVLNTLVATSPRLWVVRWQAMVVDPNDVVAQLVAERGHQTLQWLDDRNVDALDVRAFDLDHGVFSPTPERTHFDVRFADRLELLGSDAPPHVAPRVPSGESLKLRLYWQSVRPLTADYRVSLRVEDQNGHIWGQVDGRPAADFDPTNRWTPGQTISGLESVPIVPGTPPGTYHLTLTVYAFGAVPAVNLNATDHAGQALGQKVNLGEVQVESASKPLTDDAVRPAVARSGTSEDLNLIGLKEPLPAQVAPGSSLSLWLYWSARRDLAVQPAFRFQIRDAAGHTLGLTAQHPFTAWPPGFAWRRGDTLLLVNDLLTPAASAAGQAHVFVSVETNGAPPLDLGAFEFTARARPPEGPPPRRALHVPFAQGITLDGFDVDPDQAVRAGSGLKVTLHWSASLAPASNWTVFVHLITPNGKVIAQHDGPPGNGALVTSGWLPGDVVLDPHDMVVPSSSTSYTGRLEVGLYDPASGKRDPTLAGEDHVNLTDVAIAAN